MRPRLLVFLVAALLPSIAGAVELKLGSQPLRLDITESLYLNAHLDPGNGDPTAANYGELLSRLNVQLAWWRVLFGFRIDSAFWAHTPQPGDRVDAGSCPKSDSPRYGGAGDSCVVHDNDPRLNDRFGRTPFSFHQIPFDPKKFFEKLYLSYSGRSVDVTLGDFYVNLGRGLVLSVRKVDELGVDTSLFGGKVAVHEGDFSAVAVAGWSNIQNVDEATALYTKDPYDFVAGGHVDYRAGGQVIIGGNVMGGIPSTNASTTNSDHDYYLRYGLSIDAPRLTRWLSFYGEYARADDRVTDRALPADALYAAATAYGGPATVLVEFKDYRNYQPWHSNPDAFGTLLYQQPPTLERVTTQINNNTDIIASRLRVDYRLSSAALLFASFEGGQSHPQVNVTDTILDAYAGAQLRWNDGRSHFFPLVGYRREHSHDDTGGTANNLLEEQLIAVEWDAAQALPRGWSLEASGLIWFRQKAVPDVDGSCDPADDLRSAYCPWREGNVYLSLKWAPRFILAGGYEFTTAVQESGHTHNFFNGSFQWNITSGTSIRLFAGGQRPGLKCISGVCRVFPAFEGAKLEVVVRL